MRVRTEEKDGKLLIFSPYNKDFVNQIHNIGSAKWNGAEKCWTVNLNSKSDVLDILTDVYGENGEKPVETCTIIIEAKNDIEEERDAVSFLGITLAKASSRDSGAKIVSDEVNFIKGDINSSGSRQYWSTWVEKGTQFKIHNFSTALLERAEKDENFELINIQKDSVDIEGLKKRREELLKEVYKIDAILEENDKN